MLFVLAHDYFRAKCSGSHSASRRPILLTLLKDYCPSHGTLDHGEKSQLRGQEGIID